ncbi:PH domain-containing protein [Bacillus swezeyi]|uniref:Bacterial Pleckstrin homology domain-containing protein n=1 Tax=Bacillus swezeyi TaxID=1925020 RepID=A0A5M8RWR5_9BACI|nr:PH domain-containing protein [Bacillus swezeyi]KAA6451820.1 hypothetical protein DX927_13975 [Bacillus swezeyi]KAA6482626.1 hypothetical protein DX928_06055 [Bacillus swezeyi]TYS36044.1 hypothetical protein FZC77_13440 [Bacillus swezeyi]
MGVFSASKTADGKKFEQLLIEGEKIESVCRLRIDQICFTNKRIIFFDNKLFSKKKVRVFLPYKSIEGFAIREISMFNPDSSLSLITNSKIFDIEFAKDTDMLEIQALLSKYLCA